MIKSQEVLVNWIMDIIVHACKTGQFKNFIDGSKSYLALVYSDSDKRDKWQLVNCIRSSLCHYTHIGDTNERRAVNGTYRRRSYRLARFMKVCRNIFSLISDMLKVKVPLIPKNNCWFYQENFSECKQLKRMKYL